MTEVTRYNKVDFSKLSYSPPENQQNVYYGSIQHNELPLYLQTSRLRFMDIKEENKQKFMLFQVDPDDFSFYDMLLKLDDNNLSATYQSSKEWFKKELPMDILETMYRRISQPFKKNEVPTVLFKVPIYKQAVQCSLYDESNNPITLDSLDKGTTVLAIIHIKGLKFLKKEYYCDMYLSQIKVTKPLPVRVTECLIEDEDEEVVNEFEYLDEEVILRAKEKNKLIEEKNNLECVIQQKQQELSEIINKIEKLE